MNTEGLNVLAALAEEAVRDAMTVVRSFAERPLNVETKAGGSSLASQVVTEADCASEEVIVDRLAPSLKEFGLALLSEERPDDGSRLTAEAFWCIDPLDGTLPFIERRPGYAVSVALVDQQGRPQLGVVGDPVSGDLWRGVRGAGLFRNGETWNTSIEAADPDAALCMFTDRSFTDLPDADRLLAGLVGVATRLGYRGVEAHYGAGAVMNACAVLASPAACYFKPPKKAEGGGCLWDYAATACLFAEAGRPVSDAGGKPLPLNQAESLYLNACGVCFASDERLALELRGLMGAGLSEDAQDQ